MRDEAQHEENSVRITTMGDGDFREAPLRRFTAVHEGSPRPPSANG